LADMRSGPEGISAQTCNFYLQSVKQFCRWMVLDQRASESPVAYLKRLNVKTDRRHDRRALEVDEMRRLLSATQGAGRRFGMTGPERAMLYRIAIETGLRANELRTLTAGSFDLDGCTVTVEAGYSKHRRQDILPLRPATATELRQFLQSKVPNSRVFRVPDKTAKMFRADLAEATIPYVDGAGRFADFHALRHTTGSWLAANGVHPKVAQTIMRHSDINLTMGKYTHTLRGQEAEAVNRLPDLSSASTEAGKALATGTDGRAMNESPQLTPKSTPTAFPAFLRLSSTGTPESQGPSINVNPKCFSEGELGVDRDRLATSVIGGSELRPEGLEPPTIGSEDRCSVQLSYGRPNRVANTILHRDQAVKSKTNASAAGMRRWIIGPVLRALAAS